MDTLQIYRYKAYVGLEWFEHRNSALFCDFINRWPSLHKAQRARTTTLLSFFCDHHSYRMCANERCIEGKCGSAFWP